MTHNSTCPAQNLIFNLTEIHTAPSRNGFSMTAKFWINDIFIGTFEDKGDGGQPFIWANHGSKEASDLYAILLQELEKLPPIYLPEFDDSIKIDEYFFIDLLHAALDSKQNTLTMAAITGGNQ
jgi:hypothetical protein